MATNDDRRRVAAELRASIPGDCALGRGNMGWSLLYRTIFGHYMRGQSSGKTYSEVASRLADLIDPSDREDPIEEIKKWCLSAMAGADGALDTMLCEIVASIEEYQHPELVRAETRRAVDRDALLALADAMERKADNFDATVGDVPMVHAGYLTACAERIREACGEVEK